MNKFMSFVRALISTLLKSEKPNIHSIQSQVDEKKERAFQFQLSMLTKEIDVLDKTISRYDEHGRATRYWVIIIWGGIIATILSQLPELRIYIGVTAAIPVLFWMVDTRWSQLLRRAVYRLDKIAEYLTSPQLQESFQKSELIGIHLMDIRAKKYENETSYKQKTNYLRIMFTRPELAYFYFGLIICSLVLNVFFWYPLL